MPAQQGCRCCGMQTHKVFQQQIEALTLNSAHPPQSGIVASQRFGAHGFCSSRVEMLSVEGEGKQGLVVQGSRLN